MTPFIRNFFWGIASPNMGIRLVPKVSEVTLTSNIWQKKKNQVNAIMHTQFDGIIFLTNMKCFSLCRMFYSIYQEKIFWNSEWFISWSESKSKHFEVLFSINFFSIKWVTFNFLVEPSCLWDSNFPTRDWAGPLQWKHQVLTTGPPGSSIKCITLFWNFYC